MSNSKSLVATLRGIACAASISLCMAAGGAVAADEVANKATVQKAFDAWAAGTGSPYDLLADNVTWTITGNSAASKSYGSRDAFINEVIKPFNARMSVGLKPTIRNMYADGDTVIVFFDAAGTAKDGQPYKNTYAWFLDLDGGKIVKASAFFDSIAFDKLWALPAASE
ncbi:nuclear transport factor 2 family protein [Rhizobium grahamii]|uniref:Nuclear transport factor 2 family protein n=1 Tax=Rhizobium grahamii TaxID=1120045 RepID=A0A5Q0C3H1_9HYPH|nr:MULTISPECIES: nuclear transport factor 2 family protein [Rhizobium]QFY60448.1 nuclear transport factor 2 family protein [Rhizobium grahamii]QRM50424.1 nuclear transport factor 2 family protein [Rhizobium sp. BG6]